MSVYILSVNGYVAAVGLKLEHIQACLSSSKLPQTIEWFINSSCLFLVVLGSRRSKIKVLAESESGKGSLPAHRQSLFSLCPQQGERAKIPFPVPFYKSVDLIHWHSFM